jgi:Fe-S-cluster-containing dehydrogenase component
MKLKRRTFLKLGAVAAGSATAAAVKPAMASKGPELPADARGMLYDTTRCIGCKACVVACREANNLKPDTQLDGIHDAPISLDGGTKNIIKLYKEPPYRSFMKQQCMHCVDPACVSACMIGAFQKREYGAITWDGSRCIGCRYCQIACPYGIPKYEWFEANPKIVKCELCKDRPGDKKFVPACCEVCPREAVIWGTRDELLEEAKSRIRDNPGRYFEDHIYGETAGGGTQVLYLSHVPFDKLGLPDLDDQPIGALPRELQHGIYKGFIAPTVLYAALGVTMLRNRGKQGGEDDHE